MKECYVCLQECEEKSPCQCGLPVHKECLKEINKLDCTVCKTPLNESFYITLEEIEEEPVRRSCKIKGILFRYFIIALLSLLIAIISVGCCTWSLLVVFLMIYLFFIVLVKTSIAS